ncbi:MAG TPA: gliding motility-associated C-terminal domain-containing protein [Saprospiraceae bacterium]|nr:gliding motility-associated C-terminal domain-containing protein [Saprospiraceae bacterium]
MLQWTVSGILLLLCFVSQEKVATLILENTQIEYTSSCDLIVDAGPDTNVCYPAGLVGLLGSIEGDAVFLQWSPANGLNNAFILNPVANISGPITYTLTGYAVDSNNPNLIANGDFQLGNTGFSTDYNYVADIPAVQNEMVPAGTYTVINNPNLVHTGFTACGDHTGGGNMMVLNGAPSFQNVWCQTIPVTPNTWYNVSAWVASVSPSSPAHLRFSINGTQVGAVVNATPIPCQWIPFNANWNSGNNTSAVICILNLNTASGGNDFAIDDISMVGLCAVEDEVNITLYQEIAPEPEIDGPAFLCAGETGTYTADFPADPEIFFYHWIVPLGGTLINGQGTTQVTIRWDDPQVENLCLMIETRCDMNEGCLEVIVGDVPDLPLISGPSSLCSGEIATLYTQEIDPDDVYDWTIPPGVSLISGSGTNEIEIQGSVTGEVEICLEVTNVCGSTVNCTFLTLLPDRVANFDTVLCLGTTIMINGHTYGDGVWTGTEHLTAMNGCDSTLQIEITEAASLQFMFTKYLCPGDSIFLQGAFQTQAGIYMDSFTTISNCDSLVLTEVIISPFDTTWIFSSTCDPASAGTTIMTFNQGNCDSTVVNQVLLLNSDTTLISLFSCSIADTGQTLLLFTNQVGCDSLVIRNTLLLRSDTTLLFSNSCDPADEGVTMQTLTNVDGCDSLVISTVSFLLSDTTLITSLTCTYSDTGTTSTLYLNSIGCDSLVILTMMYGGSDTTYISGTTCIPSNAGLLLIYLTNQSGCDSVISIFVSLLQADTTFITTTSCEPQDTGVVTQFLTNSVGCDSLIVTTATLVPVDLCQIRANVSVRQPSCFGDSAIVTIDILTGLGPFHLLWSHLNETGSYDFPSAGIYSFPLDVQGESYFLLKSANGLEILDTLLVDVILPFNIETENVSDYHGFGVPCYGDSIGEARVNLLTGGIPPLSYMWSNGENTSDLSSLEAGVYFITVTDSHGCEANSSVTITEPALIQYGIAIDDILCFGEQTGGVTLSNVQGGVLPIITSLDGKAFEADLSYHNLISGNHVLLIKDQNSCTSEEQFILAEPGDWFLDLGSDTTIAFGTSFEITPVVFGQPNGVLQFAWSDQQCENCIARTIEIKSTSTFKVTATDENGCTSQDDMTVHVSINRDIFIPNIFSPDGDGINDLFIISSGTAVKEIGEFSVFDRWGSLVFRKFHFQTNDPSASWDGKLHGNPLNTGVYAYKLIVVFADTGPETRHGDITLIR